MAPGKRTLTLVCVSALVLASCGDDSEADPTTAATSTTAPAGVSTTTTDSEPAATTSTTTSTTTTVAPAAAGGEIDLVFDDGRSWSLDGDCQYAPDNTGVAAIIWSVTGADAAGAELNALLVMPLDPEDTTPALIGSFFDADSNPFVFLEAEATPEGSNLVLTVEMHNGFKTKDDPADLTATVTCRL